MAKKKKVAVQAAPEAAEEVGNPPVSTGQAPVIPEMSANTKADVVDQTSGNVIRTYTLEEHGQNFADLAAQYAGQVSGKVRLL